MDNEASNSCVPLEHPLWTGVRLRMAAFSAWHGSVPVRPHLTDLGRAPFAPDFGAFRDRTILNVPQGTPPVGDPSSSRHPSKLAAAVSAFGV
ncbi:MAG TPA: hypothetical protein VKF36_15675 [Syntrophorhabdales bacterium]|nr:hypothetical protein [Syntrophorhabdales bacterium]